MTSSTNANANQTPPRSATFPFALSTLNSFNSFNPFNLFNPFNHAGIELDLAHAFNPFNLFNPFNP